MEQVRQPSIPTSPAYQLVGEADHPTTRQPRSVKGTLPSVMEVVEVLDFATNAVDSTMTRGIAPATTVLPCNTGALHTTTKTFTNPDNGSPNHTTTTATTTLHHHHHHRSTVTDSNNSNNKTPANNTVPTNSSHKWVSERSESSKHKNEMLAKKQTTKHKPNAALGKNKPKQLANRPPRAFRQIARLRSHHHRQLTSHSKAFDHLSK